MQTVHNHMVVIVDDDAIVGKAEGHLVTHAGAAAVYVQSGTEALQRIKAAQKPFSLIISDQQMPGMKGSELLEQVKEIAPDTIRFLITGYADMDAVTEAVNKGAIHRYISKPWDARAFSAVTSLSPDETANPPDLRPDSLDRRDLAGRVLARTYEIMIKRDRPPRIDTLDDFFELSLSENNTLAFLEIKNKDTHSLTPSQVRLFLEEKRITFGIILDHDIEMRLYEHMSGDEPFLVAQGRAPVYPKHAEIRYFFPTNFRKSGSVRPDGSIDFSDRGDIPHEEADTLLAQKTFPEPGIPGVDVFGSPLLVETPNDLVFSTGPNTRLSEQEDKIYADIAGQPHLDALGNISVFAEHKI